MDILAPVQRELARSRVWIVIWTLVKIVAIAIPLILSVAYLTLAERKVIGYMQVRIGPNRVGPFGLLQPFADVAKLLFKEIVDPVGRQPLSVLHRAAAVDRARAGGVGGDPVHRHAGAVGHQRGAAVRARAVVGRRVRHHPRRLGVELEVRVPGRAALRRADRLLRDRDGLRAGRRADVREQPQPVRDRARAGRRRRVLVRVAAVPAVHRLLRVRTRRDQPPSVRHGGRRVGDRRRLPRRVLGRRASRCSSSPST